MSPEAGDPPLSAWRDGAAKRAILDFVTRVTTVGHPDFVRPVDRIAVFDNDGTLWVEQPLPVQACFVLDRIQALAPQHPEWRDQQPFKAVLEGDVGGIMAMGMDGLTEMVMATHAGMHTEAFAARSCATGLPPRAIRVSTAPIPISSTSRCSNCSPCCAQTTSRPS